jgi:DNA-binding NtrC family response regulator
MAETRSATLLIVGDDASARDSLRDAFVREGYYVIAAGSADALARTNSDVDAVLLDLASNDGRTLGVLAEFAARAPATPLIAIADGPNKDVERYVAEAIHKPFEFATVAVTVTKALETNRLRGELRALRVNGARLDSLVGASPAMLGTRRQLARAAQNGADVLLAGEAGTGRHHAARAIHYESSRAAGPFVYLNVAAQSEQAIDSEVFGHEPGAFSGADHTKYGLLETANGGTLALKGVGELSRTLQQKLLRFLATRSFTRAGGITDVRVDVRVIATTDRDLEAAVKDGSFDSGLYDHLKGALIVLPPLRKRTGDVGLLGNHFIERCNGEFGTRVRGLAPEAIAILTQHRWPRNVAELRNVVERTMLFAEGEWIVPDDLPDLGRTHAGAPVRLPPHGLNLSDIERQLVIQALERSAGNQTKAGRLLGLNRDQIRYRIEKFSLPHPHGRVSAAP